jgi:hypothetical protein
MPDPTPPQRDARVQVFQPARSAPKSTRAQIREATRSKNGVSNLAKELGVSEKTVKKWQKGGNPSKANAAKLQARTDRKQAETERRVAAQRAAAMKAGTIPARVNFSGNITISGGGKRYTRHRNVSVNLTPDQIDALHAAYENGDVAAADAIAQQAMAGYFNSGGYGLGAGDVGFDSGSLRFV